MSHYAAWPPPRDKRVHMQDTTRLKPTESRHGADIAAMQPRAAADWKPQPCGLSREELRRIVRKMLG